MNAHDEHSLRLTPGQIRLARPAGDLPCWYPWRRLEGCLIGLSGPAGAGKTTAAQVLISAGGFVRESFAGPIRDLVMELYPGWREEGPAVFQHPLKEWSCPRHGLSPREALRRIGEGMRKIDPEIWILALSRRLRTLAAAGQVLIVVDDVRTEAEAALIRGLGGRVIHVSRVGMSYRRDHPTELGIAIDAKAGDDMAYNYGDLEQWVRTWEGFAHRLEFGGLAEDQDEGDAAAGPEDGDATAAPVGA